MAKLIALAVYLIALFGTLLVLGAMPVVFGSLVLQYRQKRDCGRQMLVALAIVAGFFTGGAAAWNLLPIQWDPSFLTTLRMSVDADTYGHELEHQAESILVAVMFCSVVGAVLSGVLTQGTIAVYNSRTARSTCFAREA